MTRSIPSLLRRHRQRPEPDTPRYHLRASGALALWRLGDDIAMFQPVYHDRGLVLPGGGLEQDEMPEEAVTRELLEETGLRREPVRLLVIESVRADPVRGKPAGDYFIFEVAPLTTAEWDRVRLPPEELSGKFRVPPSGDFGGRKVAPAVQRRIRWALKAQATGALLRLPPIH